MLGAQRFGLFRAHAGVAEHAALVDEVTHIAARQLRHHTVVQALTHHLDALAHGGQLIGPLLAQRGRLQHLGHQHAAVGGRAGIVAAHGRHQLADHQLRLILVRADHAQAAHALAIQREALGKRVGHEEAHARVRQRAQRKGILVDAIAKALVGNVQVGQQLAGFDDFDQLRPLRRVQVHAGRVVAAGVQQHDALRRQRLDRREHGVELQALGGGVVVGVGVDLKARAFKDGLVVVPGRVAHPHLRAGEIALEEVSTHLEAARTTQGLDGGDAPAGHSLVLGAEQQLLHGLAVGRVAGHRQVGLGADVGQQLGLGRAHGVHHRQATFFVKVDADAEVDLALTRVFLEVLVEGEDGVARVGVNVTEHGWVSCGRPHRQGRS